MANRAVSLTIRDNRKFNPTKPWMVNVPRSMNGGARYSPSFPTKGEAIRWSEDFAKGLVEKGRKEAVSNAPFFSGAWNDFCEVKDAKEKKKRAEKNGDSPGKKPINRDGKTGKPIRTHGETRRYFGPKLLDLWGASRMDLLTALDIEKGLLKLSAAHGWEARTTFNAFSMLRTFYRWAHARGLCPANLPELLKDDFKKPPSRRITITPLEMKVLLHCTSGRRGDERSRQDQKIVRRFLAAGGFAGTRTAEIQGMRDKDFHWQDNEMHVPPEAIKDTEDRGGTSERYVRMLPAFVANFPEDFEGLAIPISRRLFEEARDRVRGRAMKIFRRLARDQKRTDINVLKWDKWPKNCLRHTFLSALLAITKNAPRVAQEGGHQNIKTLKRDYERAMKERVAAEYFSLGVEKGANIIPFQFHQAA